MHLNIDPNGFKSWLAGIDYANHGDLYERKYCSTVLPALSNVEQFWRVFTVPLTTRMDHYPGATGPSIRFRSGIREDLQEISAANYSVFMHLAFAKHALDQWNEEQSLEMMYFRLSSAFDVFQALCFGFIKVLHSCQGIACPGMEELDSAAFQARAAGFFKEKYEKSFKRFLAKGQTVTLRLHNSDELLSGYFQSVSGYGDFRTHADVVRCMRNAIVHDSRLGRIMGLDGKLLIPKPKAVNKYRTFAAVQAAAGHPNTVTTDFVDPKRQAESDFEQSITLLMVLYEKILTDFADEFYHPARNTMRNLFLLKYGDPEQNPRTDKALEPSTGSRTPDPRLERGVSLTAVPVEIQLGFIEPPAPSGVVPVAPRPPGKSDSRHQSE